jgi:hypothetical protein
VSASQDGVSYKLLKQAGVGEVCFKGRLCATGHFRAKCYSAENGRARANSHYLVGRIYLLDPNGPLLDQPPVSVQSCCIQCQTYCVQMALLSNGIFSFCNKACQRVNGLYTFFSTSSWLRGLLESHQATLPISSDRQCCHARYVCKRLWLK